MRIAIAGASGTGKTTLARAISEKYNIPINPVGARSVALEMGFDNPYDVDQAGKRVEFQRRLFEAKRAWEAANDRFVTDRTTLDNLTYCALHMPGELEDGQIEEYSLAMRRYDLVLTLRLEVFQDLNDGVRQTNIEYHRMYQLVLDALLNRAMYANDINNERSIHGSLESREIRAFVHIEDCCSPHDDY